MKKTITLLLLAFATITNAQNTFTTKVLDSENQEALINMKPLPGTMIVQDISQDDIFYLVEKRVRVGGESLVDA